VYFRIVAQGAAALVLLTVLASIQGYLLQGDILYREDNFFAYIEFIVIAVTMFRLFDSYRRYGRRGANRPEEWELKLRKKEMNKRKRKRR